MGGCTLARANVHLELPDSALQTQLSAAWC